ncbi:hypothetical protein KR038_010757 [Drosophila bunnanda]|nr:hypothetical protein KR038_010757 [Drosophila bunnanda]
MSKLSLILLAGAALLGCLVAQGAAGTLPVDSGARQHQIKVVRDIRAFAAQHPGVQLHRMEKQTRVGSQVVRYNMGARISGDQLVAQGADTFEYPRSQDVSMQLTYPEEGTGAIVSYVEFVCTQDSNDGSAYVVAGGIGQRFISIVLEASNTRNFSYQAQYYGLKN